MRLTVRGVIAAGVALLFVAALSYAMRGPIHSAAAPTGAPGGALAAATTSIVQAQPATSSSSTASNAPAVRPMAQTGQLNTVNIGLKRRGHHEGHEHREGGEGGR